MPLPWLGASLAFVLHPYSMRDDRNTADGGRASRIDVLMDADRPAGPRSGRAEAVKHSRMRKIFCVSESSRLGGSGLYEPEKE